LSHHRRRMSVEHPYRPCTGLRESNGEIASIREVSIEEHTCFEANARSFRMLAPSNTKTTCDERALRLMLDHFGCLLPATSKTTCDDSLLLLYGGWGGEMEGGDHPSHLTHVERVDVIHRKHSQHHHFQHQATVAAARRPADAVGIFFVIILSCSASSSTAGAASRARYSPRWSIHPLQRYTCR
jgi:hypothetical protein